MSNAYEVAKAEVLARSDDPHMGTCIHCAPYVEELVKAEIEGRRLVLAEIRERYRNAPVEDVDDSNVVGFGNRVSTDQQRPPRRAT